MDAAIDTSTRGATVNALLAEGNAGLAAAGVGAPRLDAELLLAATCGCERAALYARGREPVSDWCAAAFRALLARRVRREPLQYIVGRQEFWSLDFTVTPDVLIPRPETELLVELAVSLLSPPFEKGGPGGICGAAHVDAATQIPLNPPFSKGEVGARPLLCDVGTGSGCIAVALARELPNAEVWALDFSADALLMAEVNAQQHGVAERIRFLRSDLFATVPGQRFDVIVSNPPYLTADDLAALQPEVAFEPRAALDGGADGLDVIRRLLAVVPNRLADGGWLLMEIGAAQAAAVEDAARAAGFSAVAIRLDYAGLPRVLTARR